MRFRLDAQHYRDDILLEPGMEVGDGPGTAHPWRDKTGKFFPISMQMTPVDEEARMAWAKKFGKTPPMKDPTEAIPLQGTFDKTKSQRPGVARPGTKPDYADYISGAQEPVVPQTGLAAKPPAKPQPGEA